MDPESNDFPFLTRKMLSFEHSTRFQLKLSSQSRIAGTLLIRGFTREGIFTFTHTVGTTGVITTENFSMPDIPIMLSVQTASTTIEQGDCRVSLQLMLNGDSLMELCSGFIYSQKALSWPYSNTSDYIPGHGRLITVNSTNPVAGAEPSIEVPAHQVWRFIAARTQLVAAAAAASRRVHLVIDTGNSMVIDCFSGVDQIISETKAYSFANFGHIPDETDDNDILVNTPAGLWLPEGGQIRTETTNLNAGDDFTTLKADVELFYTL